MADIRVIDPVEKTELSNARPGHPASAGNSILARMGAFSDSFDRLARDRIVPFNLEIEEFLGPVEAIVAGKRVLLFGYIDDV